MLEAKITQQRPAESMAGETSQQPVAQRKYVSVNDCLFWPYYWLEFTRGRLCVCCKEAGQHFGVAKICESEFATMDTHLVLWSTRATPGISASIYIYIYIYNRREQDGI
jgi:hypothetical protein